MDATPQENPQDFGGKGIQDIIGKVLPYWPLFLILIAVGAAIAYFKLRSAVPVYQAHASLLIKDDEQQSNIIQQLGGGRSYKNLQNEMAVLQSRPVSKQVVRELHLYAPIIMEGRVRKSMSAYIESPVVFRMAQPDSLRETGPVRFTYNQGTKTVSFNGKIYPINQYVSTPYGRMIILINKYSAGQTNGLPMYFSLVSLQNMAGIVQGSLNVKKSEGESSILELTYNDQSPERAEDILNILVKVYNKAAIEDKNKLSENTLNFLDVRLDSIKQDLDSVEQTRQNFRAANRIVDIGVQGEQYLQSLSANDQQITTNNLQLTVLDQVQKYLVSQQRNSDALVPAIASISDPILNGQLQRLYTAESKLAQLSAVNGENAPTVVATRKEIETIRPTILEQVRNQRQNYLASRNDLNTVNNRYNGLLSELPAQERALIKIDRQQQIKSTIYTFLLQKREETALTYASTVSDSRLVDDAETSGIISPNVQNTYLQWILSAIVLGALFIFIRENLNRNILSKAEIEKLTTTPVIAEIAYNKAGEAVVVEQGSRTLIAEQFRYLRTSLSYIGINADHKKILFTSSISGEGKSFITTNLGATLAITGKKVVILEMDLRKPKLSEMLNLDKNNGLTDYFIGAKSIAEIVKPTHVKDMYLISSGAIPPNPAELLLNGKLQELLTDLGNLYDYVLVDTAPVSPVTDAYIISPFCDATLYVVRQGRSPRVLVQKLNDVLRNRRLRNMSIVFNGVKQKRFGGYYGYGYTYGYGYLDETQGKKKKTSK